MGVRRGKLIWLVANEQVRAGRRSGVDGEPAAGGSFECLVDELLDLISPPSSPPPHHPIFPLFFPPFLFPFLFAVLHRHYFPFPPSLSHFHGLFTSSFPCSSSCSFHLFIPIVLFTTPLQSPPSYSHHLSSSTPTLLATF